MKTFDRAKDKYAEVGEILLKAGDDINDLEQQVSLLQADQRGLKLEMKALKERLPDSSELSFYLQLREYTKSEQPLKLLWLLLTAELDNTGEYWLFEAFSIKGRYRTHTFKDECSCIQFDQTKRCLHQKVAALLSRLRWRQKNLETVVTVGDTSAPRPELSDK